MHDDVDNKRIAGHAENKDDRVEENEQTTQPSALHDVIAIVVDGQVLTTAGRRSVHFDRRQRGCNFRFRFIDLRRRSGQNEHDGE